MQRYHAVRVERLERELRTLQDLQRSLIRASLFRGRRTLTDAQQRWVTQERHRLAVQIRRVKEQLYFHYRGCRWGQLDRWSKYDREGGGPGSTSYNRYAAPFAG